MKYLTLFFISASLLAKAQILNAYAKISNLNGTGTTFTITNVNEASHTFTVGGQVVVMQMQDDLIGGLWN